ncbi:MAG: GNAT family N-acetyltransferase [Terracidiphilus sp.]
MTNQPTDALPELTFATDADVPAVVSLINLAFRGRGKNAGWSNEEKYIEGTRITEDLLREDMAAKPHATMLLWRQPDGSLLGCVWMQPEHEGVWYLGLLAVDPSEQQAGLGRKLLQAAEEWTQERGANEIRMTVVHLRSALIEWYKRRGYVLTGETKPFPYGDTRFGIPKRDDLYFVVLQKRL